jgi:hypothetical protein
VWRLDARTGARIWHNELKGMGRGLVSLASSRAASATGVSVVGAEKKRRDAQAAAAGAAAAGAG